MQRLLQAITNWEWLLLLLLLPLLLLNAAYSALILLILPVFLIIRKISSGHFFPRTPFNSSLVVLALSILVSLTAVFSISLSLPKISGLVLGIALYFAAVEHCRQRANGIWHILGAVILAGTTMAIAAVPFARWPTPAGILNQASTLLPQRIANLPGTADGLINLNELAGVLTWIVPLIAAVLFGYWRPLWRSSRWIAKVIPAILAASLVITSFILLASGSRGGIASVSIALLVMLAIKSSWGRWLLLAGLLAGVVLLFVMGPELLLASPADAAETLRLQGRLEIWSRGIEALSEFPLTGLGMNGFRRLVQVYYPLTLIPPTTDIGHAHNHLLQAGLDLGLGGMIAYLSLWILSAGLLWGGLRTVQTQTAVNPTRPLMVGLAGALSAGWLFGILDAIALGARPGFIWWLLIALVAASTSVTLMSETQKES